MNTAQGKGQNSRVRFRGRVSEDGNAVGLTSILDLRQFFSDGPNFDFYISSQAIFEPPPENWRRLPGRPRTTWMKNIHDDLSSLDLGIHEARDPAQNRPLCRLMSLCTALRTRSGKVK